MMAEEQERVFRSCFFKKSRGSVQKLDLKKWWPTFDQAVQALGFRLIDVDLEKEEGEDALVFYIYKEGGVSAEDTERVSRALSPQLDQWDPISGHYLFVVSSPDLSRPLRNDRSLEINLGNKVEVSFYQKRLGEKKWVARLLSFNPEEIIVDYQGKEEAIPRADLAQVKLFLEF